jgi:hypothetical protein
LYDNEIKLKSLVLQPPAENSNPPEVYGFNDLITLSKKPENSSWIIDPDNLERGLLIEAEVQLEADPIFHTITAFSSLLEILEENPELFDLASFDGLIQAKSIPRIVAKLLVGLIPIRGLAVDYKIVKLAGKEWIVHQKLLDRLHSTKSKQIYPLYIVGVVEQSLFWKDIRRILFSNLQFRILGRIAQHGIQPSWTPVKLVHMLEFVVPGIATQIENLGRGAFNNAGRSNPILSAEQQLVCGVLENYAKLLAQHYDHELTSQDLVEVNRLASQYSKSFKGVRAQRPAFEAISTFVLSRFKIPRDPDIVAKYRDKAREVFARGLPLDQFTQQEKKSKTPHTTLADERFIDSEIIAIYW